MSFLSFNFIQWLYSKKHGNNLIEKWIQLLNTTWFSMSFSLIRWFFDSCFVQFDKAVIDTRLTVDWQKWIGGTCRRDVKLQNGPTLKDLQSWPDFQSWTTIGLKKKKLWTDFCFCENMLLNQNQKEKKWDQKIGHKLWETVVFFLMRQRQVKGKDQLLLSWQHLWQAKSYRFPEAPVVAGLNNRNRMKSVIFSLKAKQEFSKSHKNMEHNLTWDPTNVGFYLQNIGCCHWKITPGCTITRPSPSRRIYGRCMASLMRATVSSTICGAASCRDAQCSGEIRLKRPVCVHLETEKSSIFWKTNDDKWTNQKKTKRCWFWFFFSKKSPNCVVFVSKKHTSSLYWPLRPEKWSQTWPNVVQRPGDLLLLSLALGKFGKNDIWNRTCLENFRFGKNLENFRFGKKMCFSKKPKVNGVVLGMLSFRFWGKFVTQGWSSLASSVELGPRSNSVGKASSVLPQHVTTWDFFFSSVIYCAACRLEVQPVWKVCTKKSAQIGFLKKSKLNAWTFVFMLDFWFLIHVVV